MPAALPNAQSLLQSQACPIALNGKEAGGEGEEGQCAHVCSLTSREGLEVIFSL